MKRHEKPKEPIKKPNVKKGDEVVVICGKDSGKRGKVMNVDAKQQTCTVEKINEYKKHQKPVQTSNVKKNKQGGIITIAMPLHLSNVMVIDKSTRKPTRVGRKLVGEKFLRYAKISGQLIDSE